VRESNTFVCIINDTPVSFSHPNHINGTYGGTASFLSGYLKYLIKHSKKAELLGNFVSFSNSPFGGKTIKAPSNIAFMVKLGWYLLFSKKKNLNFVIYCHRPDHLAIALLAKGKHAVHLHGQPHTTMNVGRSRIKKFIYNILEGYAMPKAGLVIATDSITAKLYTTLYPSITSRLIIIPTGVNLVEYNIISNSVPFPGMLPSSSNLVYIGRLAYPKKVSAIISSFANAFENDSATHLWIAGTGPDEHQLRHQASQTSCSDNIHFTGILTRESVKSLIHSSDAGILLSHNEGSPITVKEFLACGKPVILNNVGDISTYVTDGVNGFIVDPQQPGNVENAMTNILHHAKEMSASCRASMLPYDEEKIFEQVHKALLALEQN